MNNFADFWNTLGYNRYLLIILCLLFLLHIINIIYRGTLLWKKQKPVSDKQEGVSVIITSCNKAHVLRERLDAFLTQDYPLYEVIVVDECSEDETQDILSDFQKKHPHLRTSRIFPGTKFRNTKKIAINIGVLAAQYDILLFSEIDCVPASDQWISKMQSFFDPKTTVVVGFSNYPVPDKKISIRRYFRFLWFWKNIVFNKFGINVMGNGSNMGYRKKHYLEKKGFTGNTQEYIGYDTEMVQASPEGTVTIVKDPETHMVIHDIRKKAWKDDYAYHYATKRRWPFSAKLLSSLDFVTEAFVYLLSFYLLNSGILSLYILILVLLTILLNILVINHALRHLRQTKLFLTLFIVSILGFVYKTYFSVYSIFISKKWR